MGSHSAFFYGTLMAPPVLERVIWGNTNATALQRKALHIRPAILHQHRRHRVRNADYPAVVPADSSSTVRGTLVTGLTDGDLWRLDIFEGDEYERRNITVRVLKQKAGEEGGMGDLSALEADNEEGEEVNAETYIWISDRESLDPEEWDFKEFVRDKMKRWAGREAAETDSGFQGRQSIIDVDNAVAALENDPTRGRGMNGNITKALEGDGSAKKDVIESAV